MRTIYENIGKMRTVRAGTEEHLGMVNIVIKLFVISLALTVKICELSCTVSSHSPPLQDHGSSKN